MNKDGSKCLCILFGNSTPDAVNGSFTAQQIKVGNKRPRPIDLDTTENVIFLGKQYPTDEVEHDAFTAALFGSDDEGD